MTQANYIRVLCTYIQNELRNGYIYITIITCVTPYPYIRKYGVTHVMIVACYHPLPLSACMLNFDLVSILSGTSIPTSFNILVKMFLHLSNIGPVIFTVMMSYSMKTEFHGSFFLSRSTPKFAQFYSASLTFEFE